MVEIEIGTNEKGQRFDRFLRKYLPKAPLSLIYKILRRDAKVNLKREKDAYILEEGDIVQLYISEEDIESFRKQEEQKTVRKTFRTAYEDEDVLIADKPAGLLTHGDKNEKSDHLSNQVQGYLIAKGEYDPKAEKTFVPSPVNRIDRNTSGLVIFAKHYDALKKLNEYIRNREKIRKFYLTILCGRLDKEITLEGMIEKDEDRNISRMTGSGEPEKDGAGRLAVTHVKPLKTGRISGAGSREFTLAEIEIETGRTHQIRVQLAETGHPLAGDPKYGIPEVNRALLSRFSLTHQLLTAARLEFQDMGEDFPKLSGRKVEARLPQVFTKIKNSIKV